MEEIENRMVMDSEWSEIPPELKSKLNRNGYRECSTGIFVSDKDAFDYALEQCFEVVPNFVHRLKWTQEFKDMLVEWFYSGNWVREFKEE